MIIFIRIYRVKVKLASILSIFIRKKFYQGRQEKTLLDKLWANEKRKSSAQ